MKAFKWFNYPGREVNIIIRNLFHQLKKEKGFTLVELLVVVSILALIVTVAALALIDRPEEVKENIADYNLKVVQAAVDLYYVDNETFPINLNALYTNENGPYLRTPEEELTKEGIDFEICQSTGTVTLSDEE